MSTIDPIFVTANRLEAALWMTVAIVMIVSALRRRHMRYECLVAALAFALFGVSDLVETTTGAWWRPWWLLAWKLACAIALFYSLLRYLILRTPGCESPNPSRSRARAENPCPSGSRSP